MSRRLEQIAMKHQRGIGYRYERIWWSEHERYMGTEGRVCGRQTIIVHIFLK